MGFLRGLFKRCMLGFLKGLLKGCYKKIGFLRVSFKGYYNGVPQGSCIQGMEVVFTGPPCMYPESPTPWDKA